MNKSSDDIAECGGIPAPAGTAVYYNGTGRFAGMKGGSEFDCTPLGDRFVCKVDGVLERP